MLDLERRAQRHAALGEPTRLAIVDALTTSDRSPTELIDQLDVSTNLLAHHLAVLESAGLVERCVSNGDRRRRYVRLVGASPDDATVAATPPGASTMFVCTHNSARSQLAAALWTARTGRPATSAGTRPAPRVHPGAVAAGRRAGLDLSHSRPRGLGDVTPADHVVTVCDQAHEALDPQPSWWHWSIDDPVEDGTDEAFDAALAAIDARISALG